MRTYIHILLFICILAVPCSLPALYSDDFLIGAYSHIRSYSTSAACTDAIATRAREAGFNALTSYTAWETNDTAPSDMFGILDSDSLDVIYEDLIFNPDPDPSLEKYGYAALSSGIDMKFESEYADASEVNSEDSFLDTFFYMSSSAARVGSFGYDEDYSNDNYWSVPDSSSGYAYKDITYRWPHGAHYDRVGNEFRFLGYTTNGIDTPENNKLTVRYVFRVDDLGSYSDSDTLAVFSFVKYDGMTTEFTVHDSLYFYQGSAFTKKYVLTKAIYESLPLSDTSSLTGCKALEFQFPLKGSFAHTLDSQGMLSDNAWHLQMNKSLNPWMYWCGRGSLRLDYIEYYDDVFANYTNNPAKRAKLRNFESVANLRHFYGMDEPKAPNFESFKKLREHLQATFPMDARYIVTANDLDRWHLEKPDTTRYRR
ncbi:MAG TPA: hypothetical protein PLO35_00305 [Candidatus Cloacimonadota bacterium]|nr:hypothetical protein [Candidatus Cloacimonadota bacterium]